jgi:hypothetical protein
MPARDAADGRESSDPSRTERAPAGGARFVRRNGRLILGVVVCALVAAAAWRGAGGGGDGDDDAGPPTGRDGQGASSSVDGGSVTTDSAAETTVTLTPPDVAHERPDVDLDAPPDGSDRIEVARWWTAVYVAYIGAEPPTKLADRLAPLSGPDVLTALRALPPAASYDAPLELQGITATDEPGGKVTRITVETDAALVVYDVTLSQAQGGWRVDQATRV